MFGGPIDMTPFGAIVNGIGVIYWLLVLGALALALWKPRRWGLKLSLSGIVLAAGVLPVAIYAHQEYQQQKQAKARLDAAMAHFEMRCRSAGEKIHQVIQGVEGIMLLKLRTKSTVENDPMLPGAAMFGERTGEEYIKSFLGYESADGKNPRLRGAITSHPTERPGYKYVDVIDVADGQRYRYSAPLKRRDSRMRPPEFEQELHRERATTPVPRYGVTFEDMLDSEDRRHWVAGTKLQVIDTANMQVIAEQTFYLFDTGLGSEAGFRSPWGWASSSGRKCPESESAFIDTRTRLFVDRVLLPMKREDQP